MDQVTIQVSSRPILRVPQALVKQLGVRQGEQVSVQVRNGMLRIRKNGRRKLSSRSHLDPGKRTTTFMDLVGIVSSKPGSPKIDIETLMSHHGYEQLEGKQRADF